jgi:hypothetical protein
MRQSYHEVHVTIDLKSKERTEALVAFIGKHISDFQGKTEEGNIIPRMLFERSDLAHSFAKEQNERFDIPREHITVKARK